MRLVPATMATQHPDNAFAPYWDERGRPFIGVHQEITDAMRCFQDLGVDEYMWDWEGKHADAAVIDKLFTDYYEYFNRHQLGRDKFLTFRIPNVWEEKGYSLLQAMSVILTSEDFARDLKFANRPLFEVILPMTERADQLIQMQQSFQKLAQFKSAEFTPGQTANNDYLELIPLVESVESQQNIDSLLEEYVRLHQQHFGTKPAYIRPFLARSDPALVSGLLATVIANKIALSKVYEFSRKNNIPVFPIAGVGSLPFRGGLTPDRVQDYIAEHPGMRTVSIQSSFRYDHPLAQVKAAIRQLEQKLPDSKPHHIDQVKQTALMAIGKRSAEFYQETLRGVASDMKAVFAAVPRRRERRQHIGLLAYGRSMGEQKLPRAITFTAGFYSLGVPPEFIGLGRTLNQLSTTDIQLITGEYRFMQSDLERAGRFLNVDNLAILASRNKAWKQVEADIVAAEALFGVRFGPRTHNEKVHKNLTSNVLLLKNGARNLSELITETGELRKSLG
jgi:phosphoenolpyruvate carboxylase